MSHRTSASGTVRNPAPPPAPDFRRPRRPGIAAPWGWTESVRRRTPPAPRRPTCNNVSSCDSRHCRCSQSSSISCCLLSYNSHSLFQLFARKIFATSVDHRDSFIDGGPTASLKPMCPSSPPRVCRLAADERPRGRGSPPIDSGHSEHAHRIHAVRIHRAPSASVASTGSGSIT